MTLQNAAGWRPEMGPAQHPAHEAAEHSTVSGDRALNLEEPLIFELAVPGTTGVDFESVAGDVLPGLTAHLRADLLALPGLSEPETVRHYTRLSRQNYAIDLGPFPLGSCTMKHNPRLNEESPGWQVLLICTPWPRWPPPRARSR